MIKNTLFFTILTGLTIINTAYAQTATVSNGSVTINKTKLFKAGLIFLSAKTIYKNKGAILVGGVIATGAGIYGFSKLQYAMFKKKIANHKDHEQEWINLHEYENEDWLNFIAKLEQDYETTDDLNHKTNISDFKKFVAIDEKPEENFNYIVNSSEFQKTYVNAEAHAIATQNNRKQQQNICQKSDLTKLVNGTSYSSIKKDYSNTSLRTTPEFFVNEYGYLKSQFNSQTIGKHGFDHDHIPSYKAVETFLSNEGLITLNNVTTTPAQPGLINKGKAALQNKVTKTLKNKTNRRNSTLEKSLTAITITHDNHYYGSRTYFWKNTLEQYTKDSNNLLVATLLDIAFTTTHIANTNGDFGEYFNSALVLIDRNYDLCIYGPFQ